MSSAGLLPWIILLAPALAAGLITVATKRSPALSVFVSVAAVLLSFLLSCSAFAQPNLSAAEFTWINFPGVFSAPLGLILDPLSKTMLLIVTGIGSLIQIYSIGYMRDDDGKSRYFAGLSLFIFAMLGIVLSNNFVMLFIFWELVGFTSYLLIGHWFERPAAADAAKKAFLTNRVGDFGFMLGILMLWAPARSVAFDKVSAAMPSLLANPSYVTAAGLLIFCGAVAKSAQFPLHVWLPDAMEGPTPVSALIHAATMVAAGVYMLVRVEFIVHGSATTLTVISWIGGVTALMAALIATQQDDIKRILAYSTLSQLGYMVMAVGLGSNEAAMFHLFTHAFFKALLFLGAGAVIIMLHHEQDIWKMGGLRRHLPVTFLTFTVGSLALIGCPPFSGFFSKDAILVLAYQKNGFLFAIGLFTAFLTAFYVTRLLVVAFLGHGRNAAVGSSHEAPGVMTGPLVLLAIPSFLAGFGFFAHTFLKTPEEHDANAMVPVLAVLALIFGVFLGFVRYLRRKEEPFDLPLLRRAFYIDRFYGWLIEHTQEALARISAFIDRWVIDVGAVRGSSSASWGLGSGLRLLQLGNLQAYAFLFGLGIIALIYFTVLR